MKVGKWHPVVECLSRWARIRLLRVLLHDMSQGGIAKACGTTRQAVHNWLHRETHHPNDKNAVVLLELAWQMNRAEVQKILLTEAKRYLAELRKIGIRI